MRMGMRGGPSTVVEQMGRPPVESCLLARVGGPVDVTGLASAAEGRRDGAGHRAQPGKLEFPAVVAVHGRCADDHAVAGEGQGHGGAGTAGGGEAEADPKARVKWAGPEMSVRSSISARLMETWAHGQAVYDLLGQACVPTDRLKNIVVMGVNTFGWTFRNRGLEVPAEVPYLRLTAPSGEIWEWNGPGGDNVIEGQAVEFCQIVTQVRNIADTSLDVKGAVAERWMSMAQCFAGPPEDPPPPGTRFSQR